MSKRPRPNPPGFERPEQHRGPIQLQFRRVQGHCTDCPDDWNCRWHTGHCKLTIEFREAVGSMDAEWISAWGRICTDVVLFAQNASTTDFFAMIIRLAQAQGDFGNPGLAPYDFIDFLDDIGCFAEAEYLEIKMQDKLHFWYPCRKLIFNGPNSDPAKNPSTRAPAGEPSPAPPLGGTPASTEDSIGLGDGGRMDFAQTETGAPEHQDATEPQEEAPTATEQMEGTTGPDVANPTISQPSPAVVEQPTITLPEDPMVATEEERLTASEGEQATNSIPENLMSSIEDSMPEQKTEPASQAAEMTPQEKEAGEEAAKAAKAEKVAAFEKMPLDAYRARFPHAHELKDV